MLKLIKDREYKARNQIKIIKKIVEKGEKV